MSKLLVYLTVFLCAILFGKIISSEIAESYLLYFAIPIIFTSISSYGYFYFSKTNVALVYVAGATLNCFLAYLVYYFFTNQSISTSIISLVIIFANTAILYRVEKKDEQKYS